MLSPARSGEVFGGLPKGWKRIAKGAGLEDVTPHTLRHSFASVAGDLGYTEPTIAALLGHAAGSVTSRYVHHLDSVLIAAADRVAEEILRMMTARKNGGRRKLVGILKIAVLPSNQDCSAEGGTSCSI